MGVWNGRRDWLLCANYPGHEGGLTHVSGTGIVVDCRKFCPRREAAAAAEGDALPQAQDGAVRYIPLGDGRAAIVDAADFAWLSQYHWRARGTSAGQYAYCTIKGRQVLMHRLITNPPAGKVVDHINGNKEDNRRGNLRICTQGENLRNMCKSRGTSRFKGVFWHKRRRKWGALIGHLGKSIWLGYFDDEIEAALAYDRKARELFGAFACLNFPERGRVVRLTGKICAHSHVSGRLSVVRQRQDGASCRCHPVNMPTTSVGMAPSHPGEERETVRSLDCARDDKVTKPVAAIVGRRTRRASPPLDERRSTCRALTGQQASTFSGSPVQATGPPEEGNCSLTTSY